MPSQVFMFSSAVENGAINKSADGSYYSIQFTNPLFLPEEAINPQIAVIGANIWNNSPNISVVLNNNKFTIQDVNGVHTVTVPDGNYDIDSLDQTLEILFSSQENALGNRLYYPYNQYFRILGNNATQKINIEVFYAQNADQQILWDQSTSRNILGFESNSPTTPSIPQQASNPSWMIAPNIAKFNAYNSFVIHSDLVLTGIQLNNNFYNIISIIPITATTGTLNIFEAHDPYPFSVINNLVGINNARYNASFWLTDEKNKPLFQSENWDIVVLMTYELPGTTE